jgi:hypothetical protein
VKNHSSLFLFGAKQLVSKQHLLVPHRSGYEQVRRHKPC